MNQKLRMNAPLVATEVIDGEAVVIHFGSGAYYGAQGEAAVIFERLLDGHTLAEVAGHLVESGTCDAPRARDAVLTLVAELLREDLVVLEGSPLPEPEPLAGEPRMRKFVDLQDLLLLDLVHDTDELGWPVEPAPLQG